MSVPEDSTPSASYRGAGGFLRRWRWPLIVSGPIVILLIVAYLVVAGGRYRETDNAYVQVAKVPVAPSINGRVLEIYVHENQFVRKGQLLFRMDGRDLVIAQQSAAADVADEVLKVRAARAAYQQQMANAKGAQDLLNFTTKEAARQRRLAAAGVASQQQVAQAESAVLQAREALNAVRQQAAQALAALGGDPNVSPQSTPAVMRAEADRQRTQLHITYTLVKAPADGIVTRVEQMPVGTYLNVSQTAFWLLSGQPWVEANFKESQLAHMKVGQPVEIKVDAYPDAKLKGHVASFSPGTGQAFSALPAQNATGNWVKVVQRLPVRIDFEKAPPDMAGRAGLSANVKVDVRAPGRAG